MCEDSDIEPEPQSDDRDTHENQAVWRRVEAFEASQPASEKLVHLAATLARMAEIIDAEDAASMAWARARLDKWLERVRRMPPSASRAELELLDQETLSFILGDRTLHAAYDVANGMEALEVIVAQLEALRVQGERRLLSDDERERLAALEELRATLDEEVRDGMHRLRTLD
jgi:hypothetical protein